MLTYIGHVRPTLTPCLSCSFTQFFFMRDKKIKKLLPAVSLKNFHKNKNLGNVRLTLSDYSINQLLKKRTKLCFQSQTDFCKFAQQCADNLPSLRLIQHPTYVISGIYNIQGGFTTHL